MVFSRMKGGCEVIGLWFFDVNFWKCIPVLK